MADTINKPSIQIRSGLPSPLSDKSPSPATKLLISHGKPNFTIPRSPKDDDNNVNPMSPQSAANNNYNPYKCANNNKFVVGTKFNGVFKPSPLLANGNGNAVSSESNEAAKVVLRRAKPAEQLESLKISSAEEDNVPEFILRQRRIQERLAKENVLDFENRRSGYFTHVMISPDSPNRTSFVETMASPAIVPSLEMPAPAKIEEEDQQQLPVVQNGHSVEQAVVTNGHSEHEKKEETEEEQKQEQEQKQVEEKHEEPQHEHHQESQQEAEKQHEEQQEPPLTNGHAHKEHEQDVAPEDVANAIEEVNKAVAGEEDDESKTEIEHVEEKVVSHGSVEAKVEVVTPNQPEESITISHTNGHSSDGPNLPTPDPSGALGVNYEPKTVVSFSQELGNGENNYPDKVHVVKDAANASAADAELQEMSKLKFDIQNDAQNGEVSVTQVLRVD